MALQNKTFHAFARAGDTSIITYSVGSNEGMVALKMLNKKANNTKVYYRTA